MSAPTKTTTLVTIIENGLTHLVRQHVNVEPTVACLVLNGGCFVNGDETWNAAQCEVLSTDLKMITMTVNFPNTNLTEALQALQKAVETLRKVANQRGVMRLGVIGASSGGYLALRLAQMDNLGVEFVVALCPVVNPMARYEYFSDECCTMECEKRDIMLEKQLTYFESETVMTAAGDALLPRPITKVLCVFADHDENIPTFIAKTFEYQMYDHDNVTVQWLIGTHDLSHKPDSNVNATLQAFIHC